MALINIGVGCGTSRNGTTMIYSGASCSQACGGSGTAVAIFTLCPTFDIGCIVYYDSGPRIGFMVDPGFYSDGINCYEVALGPKYFSEIVAISSCAGVTCVQYSLTNIGFSDVFVDYNDCGTGAANSVFVAANGGTAQICSSTYPQVGFNPVQVVDQGMCTLNLCTTYYNGSGSNITGVGYTNCSGAIISNVTVPAGDYICIVDGTLTGGGGLTQLGACTPAPACKDYYNNTGTSITGVNYTQCNGGAITNATIASGQSVCAVEGSVSGGNSGFLTIIGNC
jgi:hypothetical protein